MAREISSSTEYVLDDFDEEFPELYNALYQNALSGRARQTRKACELATLGRRLAAQPRFGGLRDPGRLVQRPSHAPEVAELTAALRTARRSAQLLRDKILGQTPQAKAAANARALARVLKRRARLRMPALARRRACPCAGTLKRIVF